MLILECSQGCYGRTDGSVTISLRNFVGEGIIKRLLRHFLAIPYHLTSRIVPLLRPENERSCTCVRGIDLYFDSEVFLKFYYRFPQVLSDKKNNNCISDFKMPGFYLLYRISIFKTNKLKICIY